MCTECHTSVAVIGVGNAALSDEGVACRILQQVGPHAPPWVEVIDAGLPGPGLVSLLEGRSKVVIVDAVDAGHPPGTVLRFRADEALPVESGRRHSLHQGDVLEYVRLAEALGMAPEEVVVIGVQPDRLSPGEKLSPPVARAVREAAELVLAEVQSGGRFHARDSAHYARG